MEWTTVILEAYCLKDYAKQPKYHVAVDTETGKTENIRNPGYDSKQKVPRKPSYCPGSPQYICLEKDCPHFAYINAEEGEYLHDNLYWNKIDSKEEEKK